MKLHIRTLAQFESDGSALGNVMHLGSESYHLNGVKNFTGINLIFLFLPVCNKRK